MNISGTTILVVEDDRLIRMSAVDLLSESGVNVLEGGCADEAIRILEVNSDAHLVFTDVEMPGTMDGLRLVHFIQNRWPPIERLVASGRGIILESQLPKGARFFAKSPSIPSNIIPL